MPSRYWELSVVVPDEAGEGVTNFVWEIGALGVVEEERPGEPPRLRAFFAPGPDAGELRARVDAYVDGLRALGFAGGGGAAVRVIDEEDWAEAWRAHFVPREVGRSLLVAPPWEMVGGGGRHVLWIEPGRAFGTGQHGSTAGCLVLLERVAARRVIDVGTGSGILAVAAARLGAAEVVAIDSDPDAVAAAAANAGRNRVQTRVRCITADVATVDLPAAPLVLANLLAAAHREHGGRYARLVAPGGTLIAGGLLDAEAEDVTRGLARHGFRRADACSVEGWTSLALDAPLHDRA